MDEDNEIPFEMESFWCLSIQEIMEGQTRTIQEHERTMTTHEHEIAELKTQGTSGRYQRE